MRSMYSHFTLQCKTWWTFLHSLKLIAQWAIQAGGIEMNIKTEFLSDQWPGTTISIITGAPKLTINYLIWPFIFFDANIQIKRPSHSIVITSERHLLDAEIFVICWVSKYLANHRRIFKPLRNIIASFWEPVAQKLYIFWVLPKGLYCLTSCRIDDEKRNTLRWECIK